MVKETKDCLLHPDNYSCQECQAMYDAQCANRIEICPNSIAYYRKEDREVIDE